MHDLLSLSIWTGENCNKLTVVDELNVHEGFSMRGNTFGKRMEANTFKFIVSVHAMYTFFYLGIGLKCEDVLKSEQ